MEFSVVLPGPIRPVDGLLFLDATWQGAPEWSDTDSWVADDAPDLVYAPPPAPGLRIRLGVPELEAVSVHVTGHQPDGARRVYSSSLVVGDHGWTLEAAGRWRDVVAPGGTYPVEVWVDAEAPPSVREVWIVLGARSPRTLGRPRPTDFSRGAGLSP
jgi:hypothetical protein